MKSDHLPALEFLVVNESGVIIAAFMLERDAKEFLALLKQPHRFGAREIEIHRRTE